MSILDDLQDLKEFIQIEGKLSESQQQAIDSLTNRIKKILGDTDIENLKQLLKEVLNIMENNREDIRKRSEYVNISKVILENELNTIKQDETLNSLYKYRNRSLGTDFDSILNISSIEYSNFYSKARELQYRLNILSYKIVFFEEQLKEIDEKITIINNYIIALNNVEEV